MSKSILDLLQRATNSDPIPEVLKKEFLQNKLHNPDIPTFDDKRILRDQYHVNMRAGSAPRNGTFSLPKQKLQQDPRKESFMMDNAIDPNTIRSRTDPDSAQPSLSSQSKFSLMPDSVKPAHNNVDLIKTSHTTELNYKNRLTPTSQTNQPQPQPHPESRKQLDQQLGLSPIKYQKPYSGLRLNQSNIYE